MMLTLIVWVLALGVVLFFIAFILGACRVSGDGQ